jgi:formylglycine-generating enzyme
LSELAARRLTVARHILLVGLLSWGCAEILGLEEPQPRPTKHSGGASGQATGGTSGTDAGDGGMAGTEQGGTAGGGSGTGGTGGTGDQGGTAGDPGGAGTGGASDGCRTGDRRCGGETSKTPEVCDDDGNWVVNDEENGGEDCPLFCDAGRCRECREDERKCEGNVAFACKGGVWDDDIACMHYCRNGECENPKSCMPLRNGCGTAASCCSALEVPGGSFLRDFDDVYYQNRDYRATLSAFLLDEFEVTVGRLRSFVDAYPDSRPKPRDGRAEHLRAPQIGEDAGWSVDYDLPTTAAELRLNLACPGSTWRDVTGNENLPANCVSFYVAYAFCIWDGGRLPTEAEWNFAAAGGGDQRVYPWSTPPTDPRIAPSDAVYDLTDPLPPAVGSKEPLGVGRWGHADLAGSVYEWTLDLFQEPYELTDCVDCLATSGLILQGRRYRSIRGGAFDRPPAKLYVSDRIAQEEALTRNYAGFRCARDIEIQPDN